MEETIKILLCEDDENLGMLLREYLQAKGYSTVLCPDGEQGFKEFTKNKYDIAVLDVMMPKKDGFTLAQDIRQANADLPIIFLTAKTLKEDILEGFKIGADDYITKPFNSREVVARVKAVLRRAGTQEKKGDASRIVYDGLIIDMEQYQVTAFGNKMTFTTKEMELLWCLASNPGKAFSRNQLLETIWGYSYYGDTRTVDTHIKRIRQKLNIPADSKWDITTIWGVGYKFEIKDK